MLAEPHACTSLWVTTSAAGRPAALARWAMDPMAPMGPIGPVDPPQIIGKCTVNYLSMLTSFGGDPIACAGVRLGHCGLSTNMMILLFTQTFVI